MTITIQVTVTLVLRTDSKRHFCHFGVGRVKLTVMLENSSGNHTFISGQLVFCVKKPKPRAKNGNPKINPTSPF